MARNKRPTPVPSSPSATPTARSARSSPTTPAALSPPPATPTRARRKQNVKEQDEGAQTNSAVGEEDAVAFFSSLSDEEFFGDRVSHVYMYADVSTESVAELKAQLRKAALPPSGGDGPSGAVQAAPRPIVVHVNSFGGSVNAGLQMMTVFRECRVPVCVMVDGTSCSAATFLSVLAPYRVMTRYSTCLLHEYSGGLSGKRADMLMIQEMMEQMWSHVVRMYRARTRLGAAELERLLQRDLLLDAETCLRSGVCDRVIFARPPKGRKQGEAGSMIAALPQYRLPLNALLRKTNLNHVHMACDLGTGYNLESVQALDAVLQAPLALAPRIKPVLLHVSSMCAYHAFSQVFPLLSRLQALPAPAICIIDNVVDLYNFLPALFCARRVMYDHAQLVIHLVYEKERMWVLRDAIANTALVLGKVRDVLRERTRLPADMLRDLDARRWVLSASDCLRYGLVDEVLSAAAS